MIRSFTASLLLGAALVATGCASTATGKSESRLASISPNQSLEIDAPQGSVLAVVRYPAFVEDAAADAYYKAYSKSSIGGTPATLSADSPEVQALGDSVILKSNYFALSLYKELAAKLPEHSVLLSPHAIKLDADGKLTSEPMTHAESLANVVSIDFTAYTYPDPKKMMAKEPLTFGDLITPIVSVHSDYRAAAATQGVRLASAPILRTAASNGQDHVQDSLQFLEDGRLAPVNRELDFVSYLKRETPLNIARQSVSSSAKPNTAQSYPLEKVSLNKNSIRALNDQTAGVEDPLKAAFSEGFANQIVGIINETDIDKSIRAGRAASIAQFDDSLAALTLVGYDSPDYESRLRYAERLLEAEKKYLSVQSLRLFDGAHNGEMGAQVRDMLKAEYDILERRRKLARQQNTATALAILGAVAAGGIIASDNDGRRNIGQTIALDALIQGAIVAGQTAYSTSRQSQSVGTSYLSTIAPALEAQTTIQVDLIDSNETITAIRFEDLSAKLQTLYNDSQRSLDRIATRCSYTHTGLDKTGTWLGECQNGVASGTGVGVFRNDDGIVFEYYGYAEMGQPHGAGYMIEHRSLGSRAMEGEFVRGKANGIIRLISPGSSNKLRRFEAGQDKGSAPSGAVAPSPFSETSTRVNKVTSLNLPQSDL